MDNNSSLSSDSQDKTKGIFSFDRKWLLVGVVIALVSPVSGLILGITFWTESKLKKEAKVVIALSVIWGLIFIYLSNWLVGQGYLPR